MLVRMSYFAIDWIKKWTQELISTRNSEGGQDQSWVNKFFQDLLFCHSTILLVLMTTTSESTVLWGIISISNCTQNQYRKGQHKKMASFVETLSLGKKKSLLEISSRYYLVFLWYKLVPMNQINYWNQKRWYYNQVRLRMINSNDWANC